MKKISLIVSLIASTFLLGQTSSLDFDGTDDYISTDINCIQGSGARTVEAWVKLIYAGGVPQIITEWGFGSGQGGRFAFKIQSGHVRAEIGGPGNSLEGSTIVTDNQWHHVAVTFDPTLNLNSVKLYLDGQLEAQGDFTGTSMNTSGSSLDIGGRANNLTNTVLRGSLDELRIWDTVRTAQQIQDNMFDEVCSSNMFYSNLLWYFKFNEGQANANNTHITNLYNLGSDSSPVHAILQNFTLDSTASNFIDGNVYSRTTYSDTSIFSCGPYESVNQTIYDSTGVYKDTILNHVNCDSIITIILTVQNTPTNIIQLGNGTLGVNNGSSGNTYQWLDCNQNMTEISNANSQTFTPTLNGSYAVEVSNSSCTDTSICTNIDFLGFEDHHDLAFSLYPNPTTGFVNLQLPELMEVKVVVTDVQGQIVLTHSFATSTEVTIDFQGASEGVYFVNIHTQQGTAVERVVVE